MDYKPGDIANGHVLGHDNQWHPLVPPPYGKRYARRLRWSCLVMGALLVLASFTSRNGGLDFTTQAGVMSSVLDLAFRFVVGGAIFGSIVNLVVAIPPGGAPVAAKGAAV